MRFSGHLGEIEDHETILDIKKKKDSQSRY